MPVETKTCPFCCESVDAKATRCSHCGSFLSGFAKWLTANPSIRLVIAFVIALLISAGILISTFLSQPTTGYASGNPKFSNYKNKIKIKQVRLKHEGKDHGSSDQRVYYDAGHVWLYATIENDSDQPWNNLQFLGEFKDSGGQRIDMTNLTKNITLQPTSTQKIRLECNLAVNPNKVAKTTLNITSASPPVTYF